MSLYTYRIGEGPALVLLHGWGLHGGVFSPLAQRLSDRFELWVVDLPGHGRSPAREPFTLERVVEAITEAVPPGANWLGWSLGGIIALAAARPARAARLLLVAASPRFVAAEHWPGVPPEVLAGFAQGLEDDYRATLQRFVALQARGSERSREEVRALRNELFARGEPVPGALRGGLEILRRTDLRPLLSRIAIPTLLIGGRRDTLAPVAALERAAAMLPDGRFEAVEGAGHAPFLSHPERFASAVTEFFDA